MLRELLKDDKYSRGEAALIIAGALAEPGSFSDKVKKLQNLQLLLQEELEKRIKGHYSYCLQTC
jgi:hypothetical protein